MKTIRENTTELLRDVLKGRGGLGVDRAKSLAEHIASFMGLSGPKGDEIGSAHCVVLTTSKDVTSVFHRPMGMPIVWIQCDLLSTEGYEAVEVF